jgi:hypothetical protein
VPMAVDVGSAQGLQVGDGNTQYNTFHLSARSPVSWPRRIGRIPALADCRQRRPAEEDLVSALVDGRWGGSSQVISGMGGVGKTQMAAALARDVWERRLVDLLVWVTATSRDAIVSTYARAALEVAGDGYGSPQDEADRFLAWLAQARKGDDGEVHWLIVLDDLQRPSDLRGLWPPLATAGGTLVTTRRRDAALTAGRRVADVEVFTPAQSRAYLADKLAGQSAEHLAGADELAADLGHLPLALAQAATYVLDRAGPPSRMTCHRYRRLLADRRRTLADVFPASESLPDEHAMTVAATWSLSIEHADALPPVGLARPLLEITALLNPNGIPVAILTSARMRAHLQNACGHEVTAADAEEAIHAMHRLNLATLVTAVQPTGSDPAAGPEPGQPSPAQPPGEDNEPQQRDVLGAGLVRVHALVQRAVRESMEQQSLHTAARAAADALAAVWPRVEQQMGVGQLLRANADALRESTGHALCAPDLGIHPVLFRVGDSLGKAGLSASAAGYFDQLCAMAAERIGPDHPDTLNARREKARWQGEAGDNHGAVNALNALLADVLRVLGPDHPDTLATRNEIAWCLGQAGDLTAAMSELNTLVPDLVRVLGEDHYDSLLARHDLAATWGMAGDPARAAAGFAGILPDCIRALGPDNPLTLRVRNALAWHRGEAGDPAGAAAALADLLPDRTRVVGPHDPGTLSTRHALAHWRGEAGDPPGAVSALETLVADMTQLLGLGHPQTLGTRETLARWRGQAGEPLRAAADFAALAHDCALVLGLDHPQTVAAQDGREYWQARQTENRDTENRERALPGSMSSPAPHDQRPP